MTVPTLLVPPCTPDDRLVKAFTIDGTSMRCAAWMLEVAPLLESPDARVGDVVLDGSPGQKSYPSIMDKTGRQLTIVINGFWKPDGTAWSNPEVGYETNVLAVRALLDPKGTGDGTRTASMTMPSTAVRTGRIKPLGVHGFEIVGLVAKATFTCSLPDGQLA